MSETLTPSASTDVVTAQPAPDATQVQPDADARAAYQAKLDNLIKLVERSPRFDKTNGAPIGWQATVYDQSRPELQLQTLRDLQEQAGMRPDAIPYKDGNFIYTDPHTGKPTLFRPSFLTAPIRNLAGWAGTAGEIGGAILGGIGGTMAGNLPGGIAGAGAGSVAGREAVGGALRSLYGISDPRTAGQVATDIGTTAALNAAGQAAIPAISAAGRR